MLHEMLLNVFERAMLTEDSGGTFRIRADGAPLLRAPWSFADVLGPVSIERFCAEYWGQKPLLIQARNPQRYNDLVSLEDIERCLFVEGLLPNDSVTTPYRTDGVVEPPPDSVEDVYDRLAAGKPLRVRRLEKVMPPDAPALALLRDMEATLRHPRASLSCYVSPSTKFGLGPHHDETEIFTLQICGSKRWRLFHKTVADEPGLWDADGLEPPTEEFVLSPGDFFYLPSGLVHDVEAADVAPSFSLTIVFESFRWRELLNLLVERLTGDEVFAKPMPAGSSLFDRRGGAFAQAFEQRIELIRNELTRFGSEELLENLERKHLCRSAPAPRTRLTDVARLDALGPDSVLEKAPGVAGHLAAQDGRITLTLAGGYTLSAALAAEPALRDVFARTAPFRVADMHASLGAAAKPALARKLIICGVLRVVDFGSDT